MKKKHWLIVILLISCHLSMSQDDSLTTPKLPFTSNLIKADRNIVFPFEQADSLITWLPFEGINPSQNWEFVAVKTYSSISGDIPPESTIPQITSYKPINELLISTDSIVQLFKLNFSESKEKISPTQNDSSNNWIPFYYREYLAIRKDEEYIGNQFSYDETYVYFFRKIN